MRFISMKHLLFLTLALSFCACERAASDSLPPAENAAERAPLAEAAAAPLPDSDLLAENIVLAEFLGTQEIPCRFMTADCPDKCDHATKIALFRVLSNEGYAKHSEYGDDKMEAGETVPVDLRHPAPGQVRIPDLNKGDKVKVTIQHRYTKGNVQEPIRPVTALERKSKK